jgi:hypothetical protein
VLALHSEILPGADSIFSGQPVCLSKKPSHNCRDLPDYLRFNSIPELLGGEPSAGIGADDEPPLMQRTTTVQIAGVPFENKTQRRSVAFVSDILTMAMQSQTESAWFARR